MTSEVIDVERRLRHRGVGTPPDARGGATVTAYVIGHLRPTYPHTDIADYMDRVVATFEPYGGEFLVHGTRHEVLEGTWEGGVVVGFLGGQEGLQVQAGERGVTGVLDLGRHANQPQQLPTALDLQQRDRAERRRARVRLGTGVAAHLLAQRDQSCRRRSARDPAVELVQQPRPPGGQVADPRGEAVRVQAEPDDVERRLEQPRVATGDERVDGGVRVDDVPPVVQEQRRVGLVRVEQPAQTRHHRGDRVR